MRPAAALLALAALAAPAIPARADDAPASLTGADPREEHRARRAALAALLPADAVAVVLADPSDPAALIAARANEDYFWLTGIDEPGGILLLAPSVEPGKPHRERLLLPPRDARSEVWIGPRLFFGPEAEKALGVQSTGNLREARKAIEEHLAGAKTVVLPRSGTAARHARDLFGDLLAARKAGPAADGAAPPAPPEGRDLAPLTGKLRLRKSPEEQARIRRAARLSAEGHRRAMAATRPGMAEFQVQAVLEEACRAGGCRRQAYDSIVASGPNSCILHYGRNRRILEEGDAILVDAGGEFLGYACDVTRTWPVGARFTEEQAKVYDAVLAAQKAGIAAAKPGATFKEITEACLASLKGAGYADGWVHGPCHWVGLNVHDPNGNAALGPGVVFVIEPGAYYPAKRFGVRIEDTFLMREDGSLECLSAGAPKERAEIEALRASALGAAEPK